MVTGCNKRISHTNFGRYYHWVNGTRNLMLHDRLSYPEPNLGQTTLNA